ncbi:MAG TPA: tRNA (adenosine(37)-N6)-dimethylallyltransferase MiaA [Anaerolineales bacterium]|nr:tRNA (adenosine(37)-N6)-dimethylallyltransferase MiaA [Anaerolineales bacterium]
MPLPHHNPPLIVILGPTAVGKTETALQLAETLNGEIISADSRLFYRGMDIGTAKPSPAELERVPHHLVDVAAPDETWSLAMFQRAARAAIAEIHARERLPLLVGGTGQYIRAVTEAWEIPEAAPDFRLREALENWAVSVGPDGLHARLAEVDPDAAARIDPRNLRRTIRALEVILLTGERFSTQKSRGEAPYRVLQLGLTRPRPELYARIDARIEAMLSAGFVDEVRTLLAAGYSPDLPAMSAIGYRQVVQYLQGEIDLDEAVMLMKRFTRRFVRRQANWFKLDAPDIRWFRAGEGATAQMAAVIDDFLR